MNRHLPGVAHHETSRLDVDRAALLATVETLPDETAVLFPLEVQLVVEPYTQRL